MAEYVVNKIFLAVLLLIVVVVCVYVVIKVLGIDISIPKPPRDPLAEAIACVYYRCVKGYHFVNQIKWKFINCTCRGSWDENDDGKICGDESKKHPIKFELKEPISFERNSTFFRRLLGECPRFLPWGACEFANNGDFCFADTVWVDQEKKEGCIAMPSLVVFERGKVKVRKEVYCSSGPYYGANIILSGELPVGSYYVWSEYVELKKGLIPIEWGEGLVICSTYPY